MTLLLPDWLYFIFRLGLIVVFALGFSVIWTYVFYKLTGNPRGWKISLMIGICTFACLVLFESQFERHYVEQNESVVSGSGKVMAATKGNEIVVTNDPNTVILTSRRLAETKEYEFQTNDLFNVAMTLNYAGERTPLEYLQSMHADWAHQDFETIGPYFTSATFFRDVFEKQASDLLQEALLNTSASELTEEKMETIIHDIKTSLPHGDSITLTLTTWEILE
ncbi:hypothetical protein [Alteribacter aurantiacus]|uniref:hypothetical protein n=1 Tax=Alteribacter aurantiacus TaxID=254410 RepID=UPI000405B9FB|nr:hypothetical protein [Alteribacter aurantiacus]